MLLYLIREGTAVYRQKATGIIFNAIDERFDYGEIREISIGAIQGVVIVTVAHTERNEVIRIISARKATRQEKNTYYDYLAETT
ncbi:BrnT family toxin [Limnofasciculus baicalensis]|uniref:BrnT family toxin n=1 Tax=Limnofasciculus baicalensis TaxID=3064906 RepID=UPI00281544BF|nr:BrnT family toxin [Limnofasciculus baicalensis]